MCIALDFFFFFNDTATTEIYTLSLHDALPIFVNSLLPVGVDGTARFIQDVAALTGRGTSEANRAREAWEGLKPFRNRIDRKSTRLNSSHANISYAVFCLKKKKNPIATNKCTNK